MVLPRWDGAAIPSVPGSRAPAASGHPTTRRYGTAYLQNMAAKGYRTQTMAYLASGGKQGRGFVYTGTRFNGGGPFNHHPGISRDDAESNKARVEPKHRDIQGMMSDFEYFSTEKKKSLAKQLFMAGFISKPDANLMDLQEGYANLLSSSAARYAQGQNMSPKRLLEQNIRYNLAAAGVNVKGKFSDKTANQWFGKLMGSGNASGLAKAAGAAGLADPEVDLSGKYVTTNKSVDLWSPEDARGLIRAVLHRELDRDPTEAEFEDFVATLHAKQRANPQTTKTTQWTNKEGRVTRSKSVTRGGLNEAGIQELATDEAQSTPGWAEWQAVGTFFPALLDAMGSAVPNT